MNDHRTTSHAQDVASTRELATGHTVDVPIWDWAVRLVHWAMVLLIIVLVATGFSGDEWLEWHMRAGEAMLALVLFRIIWGFVGSRHARFSSFVRGPGEVVAYARSLFSRSHARFAGHNPLGGWMVVLLLLALLVQAALGLFTNDDALTEGPLVRYVTKDLSDTLSSLHRRNVWIVLALASVHIAAAFGYLLAFRENLIAPMFTGRKRVSSTSAQHGTAEISHAKAIALLLLCAIAIWLLVRRW